MTVYADVAFAVNFIMDYFVLFSALSMAGIVVKRRKIVLGAAVGGIYGALVWVPQLAFLSLLPIKAAVGVLMTLCCFKTDRKFVKHCILVLFSAFAYGGCAAVISNMLGGYGVKELAVSACVSTAVMTLLFCRIAGHSGIGGDTVKCTVRRGESEIEFSALRDSGNTLKDPISGKPVIVAEADGMRKFLGEDTWRVMKNGSAAEVCEKVTGIRLISCKTVGDKNVLLPAVKPDFVIVDGKRIDGALVAITPTVLSDGGGYTALVGVY